MSTSPHGASVAILPARGGSRRIPRKNIRDFHGRPMIAWPIASALESGCFDRVIVSTDDEEIADVARHWGAEVPFMRPAELADDFTGTRAVLRHAVETLSVSSATPFSHVACLYATAVFVTPQILQKAFDALEAKPHADSVMTVIEFESTPFRAWKESPEGTLEMQWPEHRLTRSQDLPKLVHDAGQLYLWRGERILAPASEPAQIVPLYLDRRAVVDVDTPEDWEKAERLFALRSKEGMG